MVGPDHGGLRAGPQSSLLQPGQVGEYLLPLRSWTAEDGSVRSTVEMLAEELGPSLRWATATTTRAMRSQSR